MNVPGHKVRTLGRIAREERVRAPKSPGPRLDTARPHRRVHERNARTRSWQSQPLSILRASVRDRVDARRAGGGGGVGARSKRPDTVPGQRGRAVRKGRERGRAAASGVAADHAAAAGRARRRAAAGVVAGGAGPGRVGTRFTATGRGGGVRRRLADQREGLPARQVRAGGARDVEDRLQRPVLHVVGGGGAATGRSAWTGGCRSRWRDIRRGRAILLVGANPAETMPPIMRHFSRRARRSGVLIMVDPRRTTTAEQADRAPAAACRARIWRWRSGCCTSRWPRGWWTSSTSAARTQGFERRGGSRRRTGPSGSSG